MKTIFMGTPGFSATVLQHILDAGIQVSAVVTKQDKKRSRGKGLDYSEVKKKALSCQIPVLQPEKMKEEGFLQSLREFRPDLIVTAAYGKIVPKEILELPRYGCINVHASLLPEYRGASPIQQAIMDGKEKTGITIIQMDEGMDTGDILLMEELDILPEETADELFNRLAVLGGSLCVSCIRQIEDGSVQTVKQDDTKATYTSLIPKEAGHIDWNHLAKDLVNRIRALECYCFYKDQKIKLRKACQTTLSEDEKKTEFGEIVRANKSGLIVRCADEGLAIQTLQPPGKKPMDFQSYINGYKPQPGERFV